MFRTVVAAAALTRVLCIQPEAPAPIPAPLRELPWGQLNFLHTTDTHGWLGGHLQEPSYSADWGDYVSFARHLHRRADSDGTDLLLIDTGDRIEGNGLYDASHPKGNGYFEIFQQQQPIDLITIGNHELYKASSALDELEKTVPFYRDSYICSNVEIRNPQTGELQPLAPRYKKFLTRNQGIRVLAFAFIFDFHRNANNTVVQDVEDAVKQSWFRDAISDRDVDLIVVIGHAGLRSAEFELLYHTIRSEQWDTPIQFFGGHTHIRDYKVFDAMAAGIESGRYAETIGFMSVSNLKSGSSRTGTTDITTTTSGTTTTASKPVFARRYIDNNLYSLHHHSATSAATFPLADGNLASAHIGTLRRHLRLDRVIGCVPHDLWTDRRPYPDEQSIFTWLQRDVLPAQIRDDGRRGKPANVITNTGAVRFDIFQGEFTRDSTFLVSPFTSGFRAVYDVPVEAAGKVLELLNHDGPVWDMIDHDGYLNQQRRKKGGAGKGTGAGSAWNALLSPEQNARRLKPSPNTNTNTNTPTTENTQEIPGAASNRNATPDLTPGYTTTDDAGPDGDDTLHAPIRFYSVPACIEAHANYDHPTDEPPATVDVVYNEFVQPWVLLALEYLGVAVPENGTHAYMQGATLTGVIADWIGENWGCEGGNDGGGEKREGDGEGMEL